ncbi:hypothetical protein GJ744_005397 [Endocarpon pusillum]|uniref:Heterokaryon incompatibility domain-containing protein n=1 Tax=Endocarpon pusillum TaxID=364733 RepID=A0A8H7A5R0_9EURO|nr:hypothetical protein GJ744_005397 [Endocarpon pusillum]
MRALRKTDEIVTLWIDSICIDQSNLAEKSMQVALMRQILRILSRDSMAWRMGNPRGRVVALPQRFSE